MSFDSPIVSRGRTFAIGLLLAASALFAGPAPADASPAPAWKIDVFAAGAHFVPGLSTGQNMYVITATNIGDGPTDGGTITITDDLPAGLSAQPAPHTTGGNLLKFRVTNDAGQDGTCNVGPPVTCQITKTVVPGERITAYIPVQSPASGPDMVTNQVTVSGGGAAPNTTTEQTPFTADPAQFGLQYLETSLLASGGAPLTQAGAHPADFRIRFGINTVAREGLISLSENLKAVAAKLPPGLVVNPTGPRCTEAQLESGECPDEGAVGVVQYAYMVFGYPTPANTQPVYNMVAPPGSPAELAFNAIGAGIFVHVLGNVDPANGYSLKAETHDITQLAGIDDVAFDLWGDPTGSVHDHLRGFCGGLLGDFSAHSCPVEPDSTPFLTMPSACSSTLEASLSATSWQTATTDSATALASDNEGNPASVVGCDQLEFEPTLQARPTTNVADSPSGLEVDLHVPQSENQNTLATATLKKTVVTLPAGLTLNPSAANGLASCSSEQIGIDPNTGIPNGEEPTCPDASRLGTVEVDTPLIEDPLPGSVYLAAPHDNPFGSQIAVYVVVDDPKTGVIIKLPGKVDADPGPGPETGRLTATFDDNPQLPFNHFKLNFFGGAQGALRTPVVCGPYSTASDLTPWSGTAPVDGQDEYSIDQGPNGSCPSAEAEQPLTPSFDAGSVSPKAGAHTPFVLNLQRADATQPFSQITVKPPPGLVAKLAGTPACSDAGIARAQGRTASGDGALEQADPSCPAASKVGVVHVGAGAGPAPYYVTGNVYLAGPYKGAPLSFAIVTPAVAGPFDLGVVVTRVAIAIDPVNAQITATADPLPDHLTVDGDGFPLDVRSVQLALDRPDFTVNGTSCDPTTLGGSLLSTLGLTVALSERYQLAECADLGFKPSLSLELKGATRRTSNPRLVATVRARPGDANIAFTQVQLPKAAFIDNAHIGTPCSPTQFAKGGCPSKSIIGHATATTPLLDYPLEGNVYLRTNPEHTLPDVVAALKGPASQPIEIDLAGKTDSVKGALRNTFEAVPDAPVSLFRLELFGGKKGLIELSDGLCADRRSTVLMDGQNGATYDTHPLVKAACSKKKKKRHQHRRGVR